MSIKTIFMSERDISNDQLLGAMNKLSERFQSTI